MAMKMIAPRRGEPTRDSELLMAEPRPENRLGMEPMSVLVSGATTSEMPSPNSTIEGRTSMNTSSGGRKVDGVSRAIAQGAELTGRREYQRRPDAMRSGPATRNRRAP